MRDNTGPGSGTGRIAQRPSLACRDVITRSAPIRSDRASHTQAHEAYESPNKYHSLPQSSVINLSSSFTLAA